MLALLLPSSASASDRTSAAGSQTGSEVESSESGITICLDRGVFVPHAASQRRRHGRANAPDLHSKASFAGQHVSEYGRKHPIRSFVVKDSYGDRVERALTRTATTPAKRMVECLGLGPTRGDSTTLMVRQRRRGLRSSKRRCHNGNACDRLAQSCCRESHCACQQGAALRRQPRNRKAQMGRRGGNAKATRGGWATLPFLWCGRRSANSTSNRLGQIRVACIILSTLRLLAPSIQAVQAIVVAMA